jgi:hypothetical protein
LQVVQVREWEVGVAVEARVREMDYGDVASVAIDDVDELASDVRLIQSSG